MKKLLLAFILLLTIPFNTSCIKEITFDVAVSCTDCTYEKLVDKATVGKTYQIKLIPNDNYYLFIGLDYGEEGITVQAKNGDNITLMLKSEDYDENTQILTIPGRLVSYEFRISAIASDNPGENK